jgi:hypothetical protein
MDGDASGTRHNSGDDAGGDAGARTQRWVRVERLFSAVFEQPPHVQASMLREAAAADADVAGEVRALLEAHTDADESFLAALDLDRAATFLTEADPSPHAGQRIGPYVVERELGRGGMAVIYLARDSRLEREVALKLLSPALAGEPEARRRLLAEARAVALLDHHNIATVLDIGETEDGRMWIAMPRYRGVTLRERIAQGRMPVPEALRVAKQIVAGLGAAHDNGIIHRDIKPANVMIAEDGTAKILDFGIARSADATVTRAGTTIGTVAYMSPEQTTGAGADARSDVWAVGVVLYEMLGGRRPFQGQNDGAVIHGIRTDTPPALQTLNSRLSAGVIRVVERCLMKDPGRRYSTMGELAAALAALERTSAGEPSPVKAALSRWRGAAVLGAIAVTIALVLVWRVPSRITAGSAVDPSVSNLIVLPLAPVVPDSSLSRLGVELAITLSRALDGVGQVRIHDPLAVVARTTGQAPLAFDDGIRLARERGATGMIHGTIVRTGTGVRIDAALQAVDGERLAYTSTIGDPDDIMALTDALAVGLLRQMWRRGRAPVPDLAAITTRSIPALRAYLDGERAIGEGRFYDAPEAFERAIALDSTFWSAYWRLWYARGWHGLPVDSAVRVAVANNLAALSPADSALASSRFSGDRLQRHDMVREAVRAFPNYWPAWFEYADLLVHQGPYLGFPLSEARTALEQVVSLNPDLVPAWEHLFWVAVRERDVSLTQRILGELERLRVDSLRAPELRYDVMQYYAYLADLVRSNGEADSARTEAGAALLAGMRSRTAQENLSASLHLYGFHRAQLELLDRVLAHGPAPDIRAAHHYGRAFSWAGRGAWDSALASATSYAREARPAEIELLPAQFATVGALLGAIEPDVALSHVEAAAARARALGALPDVRAEILWLEGLSAFVHGEPVGMRRARTQLRALAPSSSAPVLERSLAAFEAAAADRIDQAGDSLAALEREGARQARQFGFSRDHPFFSATNRLLAARWLIASGDTDMADALLLFPDATFPAEQRRQADANQALAPFTLIERARIAEALGRTAEARRLYAEVRTRWDAPVPALRRLLPDAGEP